MDPLARINAPTYQSLLEQGFRRSGSHIYRPACRHCRACISLRIPVYAFAADRSQRRNFRTNAAEVRVQDRHPTFDPEHFDLYRRYLLARHPDGAMAEGTADNYRDFLIDPWGGETRLLEFRLDGHLMAVAVTDVTPGGLSAVYTFFDPALSARSPGTFAILCQIEAARAAGPALSVPRLLDRGLPQDELQDPLPPRGGMERAVLGHPRPGSVHPRLEQPQKLGIVFARQQGPVTPPLQDAPGVQHQDLVHGLDPHNSIAVRRGIHSHVGRENEGTIRLVRHR